MAEHDLSSRTTLAAGVTRPAEIFESVAYTRFRNYDHVFLWTPKNAAFGRLWHFRASGMQAPLGYARKHVS